MYSFNNNFNNNQNNCWTGPYGINVPNHITSITAADGLNTLYKSGETTEMYNPNPLTREEYLFKYSELKSDGCWYKIPPTQQLRPQNFWIGPHDVLVPNNISTIIASDGLNRLCKDGMRTEVYNPNPLTKEQYFTKYTEVRSDGYRWYKDPKREVLFFWLGPYNIRVPNSVRSVPASDGKNKLYSNGDKTDETELYVPLPISKDEYFAKYTEFKSDGHYWYKANAN